MALPDGWWRDRDLLAAEISRHTSNREIARAHGLNERTIRDWRKRHGFPPSTNAGAATRLGPTPDDDEWLLRALRRLGDSAAVNEIADYADVSPRRVREARERLKQAGYRLVDEPDTERVTLHRLPPSHDNLHQLDPGLFDGDRIRVGVVSDTHLGSREEALAELHLAYDVFAREGVREVWHAGDWGTGLGMYRTHHAEAVVHTAEEQVAYLAEHYPRRDGIVTRGIGGNHDLEGDLGRVGFDPVAVLARRRDDIDYLGAYNAWLELRPGAGSWVHLLHGSGGMSYAYSYKAQKIVDGYQAGRKPAVLIVGHWHVRGQFQARNVQVLFPGCFEWQSRFMVRLGLQPAVGFHILDLTVADDGSVVRWRPEWFPFYHGRTGA